MPLAGADRRRPGQLHAAADALESLGFTSQPLASIAKREEVIYLYGNEDEPIVLDRRSPVLHLVQMIRDESHRFAVGYHRQRRAMRDRELGAAGHSRRRRADPPAPAHPLRQPARRAAGHSRVARRRRLPQDRGDDLAAFSRDAGRESSFIAAASLTSYNWQPCR